MRKNKPLAGKTFVLTRPRSQAKDLAQKLRSLGARIVLLPTIRIAPPSSYAPLDRAIKKLKNGKETGYDWLLFTSPNGVRYFWRRWEVCRLTSRLPLALKTCAIGPKTAQVMRRLGLPVHRVAREFRAEAMVPELGPVRGKKILLPRARLARKALPKLLRKKGARVDVVEAYQTLPESRLGKELRKKILAGKVHGITFTSSSTVTNFLQLFSPKEARRIFQKTPAISIGPITSRTLQKSGIPAGVQARRYDAAGLAEAMRKHFSRP